MTYLSIKALHILAVVIWIGSLTVISAITASSKMSSAQMSTAIRITDTAIGVAWLAGIIIVVMGGWYTSSWWLIKIVLVIAISAIHTIAIRRWKASGPEGASTHPSIWKILLTLTAVVVLLAVFKRPG